MAKVKKINKVSKERYKLSEHFKAGLRKAGWSDEKIMKLDKSIQEYEIPKKEANEMTDEEIEKLEEELKQLESKDSSYGSPPQRQPKLNYHTRLLYGASDWCIVVNKVGKAYAVSQSSFEETKRVRIEAL